MTTEERCSTPNLSEIQTKDEEEHHTVSPTKAGAGTLQQTIVTSSVDTKENSNQKSFLTHAKEQCTNNSHDSTPVTNTPSRKSNSDVDDASDGMLSCIYEPPSPYSPLKSPVKWSRRMYGKQSDTKSNLESFSLPDSSFLFNEEQPKRHRILDVPLENPVEVTISEPQVLDYNINWGLIDPLQEIRYKCSPTFCEANEELRWDETETVNMSNNVVLPGNLVNENVSSVMNYEFYKINSNTAPVQQKSLRGKRGPPLLTKGHSDAQKNVTNPQTKEPNSYLPTVEKSQSSSLEVESAVTPFCNGEFREVFTNPFSEERKVQTANTVDTTIPSRNLDVMQNVTDNNPPFISNTNQLYKSKSSKFDIQTNPAILHNTDIKHNERLSNSKRSPNNVLQYIVENAGKVEGESRRKSLRSKSQESIPRRSVTQSISSTEADEYHNSLSRSAECVNGNILRVVLSPMKDTVTNRHSTVETAEENSIPLTKITALDKNECEVNPKTLYVNGRKSDNLLEAEFVAHPKDEKGMDKKMNETEASLQECYSPRLKEKKLKQMGLLTEDMNFTFFSTLDSVLAEMKISQKLQKSSVYKTETDDTEELNVKVDGISGLSSHDENGYTSEISLPKSNLSHRPRRPRGKANKRVTKSSKVKHATQKHVTKAGIICNSETAIGESSYTHIPREEIVSKTKEPEVNEVDAIVVHDKDIEICVNNKGNNARRRTRSKTPFSCIAIGDSNILNETKIDDEEDGSRRTRNMLCSEDTSKSGIQTYSEIDTVVANAETRKETESKSNIVECDSKDDEEIGVLLKEQIELVTRQTGKRAKTPFRISSVAITNIHTPLRCRGRVIKSERVKHETQIERVCNSAAALSEFSFTHIPEEEIVSKSNEHTANIATVSDNKNNGEYETKRKTMSKTSYTSCVAATDSTIRNETETISEENVVGRIKRVNTPFKQFLEESFNHSEIDTDTANTTSSIEKNEVAICNSKDDEEMSLFFQEQIEPVNRKISKRAQTPFRISSVGVTNMQEAVLREVHPLNLQDASADDEDSVPAVSQYTDSEDDNSVTEYDSDASQTESELVKELTGIMQSSSQKNSERSGTRFAGRAKTKRHKKGSSAARCRSVIPFIAKTVTASYKVGDIIWAQIGSYPYWPCMVVNEPGSDMCKKSYIHKTEVTAYHVRFFGDKGRRAWINLHKTLPYENADDLEVLRSKLKSQGFSVSQFTELQYRQQGKHRWTHAVNEAESLKGADLEEKLQFFDNIKPPQPSRRRYNTSGRSRKPSNSCSIDDTESISSCVSSKKGTKRKRDENVELSIALSETTGTTDSGSTRPQRIVKAESSNEQEVSQLIDLSIMDSESKTQLLPSPKRQKPYLASIPLEELYSIKSQKALFRRNNLFRGVSRERACYYCLKPGDVMRCSGRCNGIYHLECSMSVMNNKIGARRNAGFHYSPSVKSEDGDKSESDVDESSRVEIITVPSHVYNTPPRKNFPPDFDNMSLAEQIDYKMKEVMKKFEAKNIYEACTSSSDENGEKKNADGDKKKSINTKIAVKVLSKPESSIFKTPDNTIVKRHITADSISFEPVFSEPKNFKCGFCTYDIEPSCFMCHEKVSRKGCDVRQKCSLHHCGRYFHSDCLKLWPQTQWSVIKSSKDISDRFVCPQHVCHTCVSDNPRASTSRCSYDKIVRCMLCPTSYHTSNLCIPAGTKILSTSQIICPKHRNRSNRCINTTWCFLCSEGGNLVCCENCPTSVHPECLPVNFTDDDKFICEDCETGRLLLYDEVVWVKLGHFRWWPALILFPNEVPLNISTMKHSLGDFVVRFFGTYDYHWVNRGRCFLFQDGDMAERSPAVKKLDEAYNRAVEEASLAHKLKKEFKQTQQVESPSSQKPPPYVRIKVNKPVGNVRQLDLDLSNTTACDCDPNEPNPCGPDTDCLNRLLLTECNPEVCPAGQRCRNQSFEKREYPPMAPYKTQGRGWGLKALVPIKKGQFVIEYVGEIIDNEEYQRRIQKMHEQKDENYYFLTIDNHRMLDAGPKGNLARFMNHCCQPNCETQKWTVNGDTRVGLFATMDIQADTELTFNYNLECVGKEKKICKCGAPNCSGFIGVKAKQDDLRKKNKRKYKKKEVPTEPEVSFPCFICGELGDVLICSNKNCSKAYHSECLNIDQREGNKFICPWHNCNICSKRTMRCCVKCINSFCPAHSEGIIRYDSSLGFICAEHDPLKQKPSAPITFIKNKRKPISIAPLRSKPQKKISVVKPVNTITNYFTVPSVKKRRGRPKLNRPASLTDVHNLVGEATDSPVQETKKLKITNDLTVSPIPKRRKGRPRMNPDLRDRGREMYVSSLQETKELSSVPPSKKRGRGRPKLNPLPTTEEREISITQNKEDRKFEGFSIISESESEADITDSDTDYVSSGVQLEVRSTAMETALVGIPSSETEWETDVTDSDVDYVPSAVESGSEDDTFNTHEASMLKRKIKKRRTQIESKTELKTRTLDTPKCKNVVQRLMHLNEALESESEVEFGNSKRNESPTVMPNKNVDFSDQTVQEDITSKSLLISETIPVLSSELDTTNKNEIEGNMDTPTPRRLENLDELVNDELVTSVIQMRATTPSQTSEFDRTNKNEMGSPTPRISRRQLVSQDKETVTDDTLVTSLKQMSETICIQRSALDATNQNRSEEDMGTETPEMTKGQLKDKDDSEDDRRVTSILEMSETIRIQRSELDATNSNRTKGNMGTPTPNGQLGSQDELADDLLDETIPAQSSKPDVNNINSIEGNIITPAPKMSESQLGSNDESANVSETSVELDATKEHRIEGNMITPKVSEKQLKGQDELVGNRVMIQSPDLDAFNQDKIGTPTRRLGQDEKSVPDVANNTLVLSVKEISESPTESLQLGVTDKDEVEGLIVAPTAKMTESPPEYYHDELVDNRQMTSIKTPAQSSELDAFSINEVEENIETSIPGMSKKQVGGQDEKILADLADDTAPTTVKQISETPFQSSELDADNKNITERKMASPTPRMLASQDGLANDRLVISVKRTSETIQTQSTEIDDKIERSIETPSSTMSKRQLRNQNEKTVTELVDGISVGETPTQSSEFTATKVEEYIQSPTPTVSRKQVENQDDKSVTELADNTPVTSIKEMDQTPPQSSELDAISKSTTEGKIDTPTSRTSKRGSRSQNRLANVKRVASATHACAAIQTQSSEHEAMSHNDIVKNIKTPTPRISRRRPRRHDEKILTKPVTSIKQMIETLSQSSVIDTTDKNIIKGNVETSPPRVSKRQFERQSELADDTQVISITQVSETYPQCSELHVVDKSKVKGKRKTPTPRMTKRRFRSQDRLTNDKSQSSDLDATIDENIQTPAPRTPKRRLRGQDPKTVKELALFQSSDHHPTNKNKTEGNVKTSRPRTLKRQLKGQDEKGLIEIGKDMPVTSVKHICETPTKSSEVDASNKRRLESQEEKNVTEFLRRSTASTSGTKDLSLVQLGDYKPDIENNLSLCKNMDQLNTVNIQQTKHITVGNLKQFSSLNQFSNSEVDDTVLDKNLIKQSVFDTVELKQKTPLEQTTSIQKLLGKDPDSTIKDLEMPSIKIVKQRHIASVKTSKKGAVSSRNLKRFKKPKTHTEALSITADTCTTDETDSLSGEPLNSLDIDTSHIKNKSSPSKNVSKKQSPDRRGTYSVHSLKGSFSTSKNKTKTGVSMNRKSKKQSPIGASKCTPLVQNSNDLNVSSLNPLTNNNETKNKKRKTNRSNTRELKKERLNSDAPSDQNLNHTTNISERQSENGRKTNKANISARVTQKKSTSSISALKKVNLISSSVKKSGTSVTQDLKDLIVTSEKRYENDVYDSTLPKNITKKKTAKVRTLKKANPFSTSESESEVLDLKSKSQYEKNSSVALKKQNETLPTGMLSTSKNKTKKETTKVRTIKKVNPLSTSGSDTAVKESGRQYKKNSTDIFEKQNQDQYSISGTSPIRVKDKTKNNTSKVRTLKKLNPLIESAVQDLKSDTVSEIQSEKTNIDDIPKSIKLATKSRSKSVLKNNQMRGNAKNVSKIMTKSPQKSIKGNSSVSKEPICSESFGIIKETLEKHLQPEDNITRSQEERRQISEKKKTAEELPIEDEPQMSSSSKTETQEEGNKVAAKRKKRVRRRSQSRKRPRLNVQSKEATASVECNSNSDRTDVHL